MVGRCEGCLEQDRGMTVGAAQQCARDRTELRSLMDM